MKTPARRDTLLVVGLLTAAYALLLTPNWTPGGDSEFFAAAARSIVRGEGFVYNAKPVRLVPPGWPYVLAFVFQLSPTFLAGKLVNIAAMLVAAVFAHRTLLRFASPNVSLLAAAGGGLLGASYPLTTWLHSDPLFCATSWASAWAAVRLVESATLPRRAGWATLVLALLAASFSVRYAAVLQASVPATILLWAAVRQRRLWPAAVVAVAVAGAVGSFALVAAADEPPATPGDVRRISDPEEAPPSVFANGPSSRGPLVADRLRRLAGAGLWPAWLLFYPLRFASGVPGGTLLVGGFGLVLLGILAYAARRDVRGRPLWLLVLAYVIVLAVGWPNVNARYLVPIAPLVLAGLLVGLPRQQLRIGLVALLVIVNGGMYAADLRVRFSKDYYASYEAGRVGPFLDAVAYLKHADVRDGELAVSERYENLGRMRFSKTGTREAVLLLDRRVVTPFDVYSFEPGTIPDKLFAADRVLPGGFAAWAEAKGLKYYLFQRPASRWRLWHFRLPAPLQRGLGGEPSDAADGWVLYSAEDGWKDPVRVPVSDRRVTRLPGL